ncbi:MAG TPA: patatin-like phospholipase family protein [Chloroflexia bacterium]|nr:patatin-like phospholipase family protein [Chloroflexia bacterium]
MNEAQADRSVQTDDGQAFEGGTSDEARQEALAPVTQQPVSPADEVATRAIDDSAAEARGSGKLRPGIALCLSGGGYRAMLFHLGALWRLNELGYLGRLSRISSVSGGSITAGVLALAWHKLRFTGDRLPVAENFNEEVVLPVRGLADKTIDIWAVLRGLFWGGTTSTHIAGYYNRYLFHGRTLQELPKAGQGPDFVFNASNLQSGVLWQSSREYIGDYRVGWLANPDIGVAQAVAASSAFPPFLSPMVLKFNPKKHQFKPGSFSDLNKPPYTAEVLLTDGGVYDNLGLETAWKYFETVLVSDGGGKMGPEGKPGRDWVRQVLRIRDMTDNQVRALRKRQLIASYEAPAGDVNHRSGAYWATRTAISDYKLTDSLPCPPARTAQLANVQTRLGHLDKTTQERLINWGYAICDAAIRGYVDKTLPAPAGFPYPKSKV